MRGEFDDSWMRAALCRTLTPKQIDEVFFPERGVSMGPAKAVCAKCPVREDCLDYAMNHVERFGVWGGVSERTRRDMRKTYLILRHCKICGTGFRCLSASQQKMCSDKCRATDHNMRLAQNRKWRNDQNKKCVHCGASASAGSKPSSCSAYCAKVLEKLARRPNMFTEKIG